MEYSWILFTIAALGGFFMAFSNGANDVANAFASAVGSKALTVRQAVCIAGALTLIGAVLLGSQVVSTLVEGIIEPKLFQNPDEYILAMLSCLMAAGFFVLMSTLTGMPVSSTHSIVGSMTGAGIALGGFETVNWLLLSGIALSWVLSPILSGSISFWCYKFVYRFIYRPNKGTILERFVNVTPIFLSITGGIIVYSLLRKTCLKTLLPVDNWFLYSFIAFLLIILFFIGRRFLKSWVQRTENSEKGTEYHFKKLQIGTSCYVAFAHGSNDVANSISPVLAIFAVMKLGAVPESFNELTIPIWVLCLGGLGMAAGTTLLGYKVIATLGEKITLITNSKGFCVDFSTATTVVFASLSGIPISTTHAATGSIIGIGLSDGKRGINFSLITKIFITWIFTVPFAAGITILFYWILKSIFL